MNQIFIKVKTFKDGEFDCIDKDILSCTKEEINNYYHSVSKGVIAGLLNKFIEDKKEQEKKEYLNR